jgi:DNA invertase Pin-like site-specific DNA recombinase
MNQTVTETPALPKAIRRLNVAAYARVSGARDAAKNSLSAQVSYYSSFIQRHIEWNFAGVYFDDATTGTKADRADFQRLIDDCRAGKIDMVITKTIARFARNTALTLALVRELKELGVAVYVESERINTLSITGESMLTQRANFAQQESQIASKNAKWRIRNLFKKGQTTVVRMLGYRNQNGRLQVVPEEAEVVRQVFEDYLGGMGLLAIAKKLNASGFPTQYGGPWGMNTIRRILENEKYTGDMLLQKTYRENYLTKKKRDNHGELPMTHVQGSHEPIISREIFEQARQERVRRAALHHPSKDKPDTYPFTNRIVCESCGKRYRRKHTAAGTKYEKVVWICGTFNTQGKTVCDAQQIPEAILCAKTAEILGLPAFDEALFNAKIAEIRVPSHNKLIFVFCDGYRVEAEWKNPSRAQSWTLEMKQAARDRRNKIIQERKRE